MISSFPASNLVSQELSGDNGIIDSFSEGDGALLKLCSVFGQEEFPQLDLDSLDAAGEFLNCVNGLFASSLSKDGKFLELMPPCYEDVTDKVDSSICQIPIYIGDQKLYFTVAKLVQEDE